MGVILHESNLTDADIRFKQSVEVFSLQVMQDKFKIAPCGLFVVDMVCVQGVGISRFSRKLESNPFPLQMVSTATGFLLILIQSDLSGRFG